ncbi:MAG TPA: hypothetical protein V6D06_20755 [Trichocoleus sp.]
MSPLQLTPEDLLVGADTSFDVVIPSQVLHPTPGESPANPGSADASLVVQLRPLTIGTFQLILKAARQDASLIPLLMIKESLVEPALSLDQVKRMHLGLVQFLIDHIRRISGLTEKKFSSLA